MNRILRHLSVHLWLTAVLTIPFCFFILPGLERFFPEIDPFITGLVSLVCVGAAIGFLMDRAGKKMLFQLIKEGQTWERSGIFSRAETSYIKALRVYDTSLIWPFAAKKTGWEIAGAIAKFKVNTATQNQEFKWITINYLKMNPKDIDIAVPWLEQVQQSSIVSYLEQEVLSLLAEQYAENPLMSALVTDIFIGLERKDFTAKKLYAGENPALEPAYARKIDGIMVKPAGILPKKAHLPESERKIYKKGETKKLIQAMVSKGVVCLKRAWQTMVAFLGGLMRYVARGLVRMNAHEKAKFYLKTGIVGLVCAGLLFFMISTLSHLFKSRAVETNDIRVHIQVPKPFALQVAAYLKQKHADRYVDTLRKKGIDANVKQVAGGGKTWFVVRVSEFSDKKSATAYGRKLKQQKIIDDFFVNNK